MGLIEQTSFLSGFFDGRFLAAGDDKGKHAHESNSDGGSGGWHYDDPELVTKDISGHPSTV